MSTAPQLRQALDEVFGSGTCAVIDLSEATFVDSSVLSELVTAQRNIQDVPHEQLIVVAPPGSAASRLFGMTGAEGVLATYATREDAVRACGSTPTASG